MASGSAGGVAEVLGFLVHSGLDAMDYLPALVGAGVKTQAQVSALDAADVAELELSKDKQRKLNAAIKKRQRSGATDQSSSSAASSPTKKPRISETDTAEPIPLVPGVDVLKTGVACVAGDDGADEGDEVYVNRSPVMILWGAAVAVRAGYDLDAALSLASMQAALTAKAKGTTLGIYAATSASDADAGMVPVGWEPVRITLLGRSFAACKMTKTQTQTREGAGRDVRLVRGFRPDQGSVILPSQVRSSLKRAFGEEDLAVVFTFMVRVLEFYSPEKLELSAYEMYTTFRPEIASGKAGWGAKGQLKLANIAKLATDARFLPVHPERDVRVTSKLASSNATATATAKAHAIAAVKVADDAEGAEDEDAEAVEAAEDPVAKAAMGLIPAGGVSLEDLEAEMKLDGGREALLACLLSLQAKGFVYENAGRWNRL